MSHIVVTRAAAFEPEAVKAMTDAYDSVVAKINGHRAPVLKEMVARRILELLATAGERNPMRLGSEALRHVAL
jgi:hypothetical protein